MCRAPIYPAKGYSATIAVGDHRGAPTVSLTDLERKLVFSRFGGRLRIAGTAESPGYGKELNRVRCEALVSARFELFPDAGERESAQFWAGLRPATPSNVPLVGGDPVPQSVSSIPATGRSAGRWRADRAARSPT